MEQDRPRPFFDVPDGSFDDRVRLGNVGARSGRADAQIHRCLVEFFGAIALERFHDGAWAEKALQGQPRLRRIALR